MRIRCWHSIELYQRSLRRSNGGSIWGSLGVHPGSIWHSGLLGVVLLGNADQDLLGDYLVSPSEGPSGVLSGGKFVLGFCFIGVWLGIIWVGR